MSYDAVDWAFSVKVGSLADKAVLLALCHAHNPEKGCFPSVETIMDLTEIGSKRTVQKSLNALEAAGFIARSRKPTKKGFVNLYTLNLGKSKSEPRIKSEPTCKSEPRIKNEPRSTFTEVGAEVSLRGRCKSEPLTSNREQVKGTSNVFTRDASHRTEQNASIPDDVPAWVIDQQSSDSYSEVASTSGGASVSDCGSAVSSREDTFELTPNEPPAKPAPKAKPKTSRRKPKISCPFTPGDALSDDLLSWAVENYPTIDARAEFQNFINSALANDRRYSDWNAAFRNWCGNALRYQNQNGGNSARQPYKRDTTRFAHEWRQEDRVYGSEEGLKEMLAYLEEHGEKISA